MRLLYQRALEQFEKSGGEGIAPVRTKGHLYSCLNCSGTGIIHSNSYPIADKENYPHVAIIGGGIGGVALAVACLHRGIPFTLYERDKSFNERSQGYGLTLQQASKAIEGLGVTSLAQGVISTRHVVHTTEGKEIGEWGNRKWVQSDEKNSTKRTNVHIARQSLRLALLEQLGEHDSVKWGHQLVGFKESINLHGQHCSAGKSTAPSWLHRSLLSAGPKDTMTALVYSRPSHTHACTWALPPTPLAGWYYPSKTLGLHAPRLQSLITSSSTPICRDARQH